MRRIDRLLFAPKQKPKLEQCTSLEVEKEQSDVLYGGFKEYKPPIYEQGSSVSSPFRMVDLLTDINQTK